MKKNRKTYNKNINGLEKNIMIDELEGIGKFVEFEVLSKNEDKEKMAYELEKFIEEFECKNLQIKNTPYRDIAKEYYSKWRKR